MTIAGVAAHHLLVPREALSAAPDASTSEHAIMRLVSVTCEDGSRAWGEGRWSETAEFDAALALLAPVVEGADPLDRGALWERMVDRLAGRGEPLPGGAAALSALDIALWDLAARAASMPVYQLIGGRRFTHLDAYATLMPRETPERAVRDAQDALECGFRAVKLTLGGEAERDIEALAAVREVVGPQVALLVDTGSACAEREAALELGTALDRHEAFWYEAPLPEDRWTDYVALRHALDTPIAGLADLRSPAAYLQAFRIGALDVATPDLRLCGGMTGMLKIAELARWFDVRVSPHNGGSPLAALASAHASLTLPGFVMTEVEPSTLAIGKRMLDAPPRLVDGFLDVPEGPGLGACVNEEFIAEFTTGG